MRFYVEVIAPMDQVVIGPFESSYAARVHASTLRNTECYILSEAQLNKSFEEFGGLPILAPDLTTDTERQRNADRVDGYDRDDLGESPDY